jgi:four helix bundle protein
MDYKDLDVWKHSFELVSNIYIETKRFPDEERFGLISQMRRSAVSVVSNIAEGFSRSSFKDYFRFIEIAYGSCVELETQVLISIRLGYINDQEILDEITEVKKLLNGFKRYLKTKF